MFYAVIHARSAPTLLAATLGPLVRGVVEGLIGSALLVAPERDAAIEEIADAAGCRVLISPDWREGFARTVAISAGSPLLIVDTGVMLGPEFWPLLADALPILGDRAAATAPPRSGRLAALFSMRRSRRVSRDQVLLLPGSLARSLAQAKSDPWLHHFDSRLEMLPVAARRISEKG